MLLEVVGIWKKISENLPPLKKKKLIKKSQENMDEIKINLHKANQYWNDWKFQIHWNKLEGGNPRNRNERKNLFYVYSNLFV